MYLRPTPFPGNGCRYGFEVRHEDPQAYSQTNAGRSRGPRTEPQALLRRSWRFVDSSSRNGIRTASRSQHNSYTALCFTARAARWGSAQRGAFTSADAREAARWSRVCIRTAGADVLTENRMETACPRLPTTHTPSRRFRRCDAVQRTSTAAQRRMKLSRDPARADEPGKTVYSSQQPSFGSPVMDVASGRFLAFRARCAVSEPRYYPDGFVCPDSGGCAPISSSGECGVPGGTHPGRGRVCYAWPLTR